MSIDPSNTTRAVSIHEATAALMRGDIAGAEKVVLASNPTPEAIVTAAESAMRMRRWDHAAWFFEHVAEREGPIGIKRSLSRNLASLQKHRPSIYKQIISLPKNDSVGIGTSATGHPTIVCRTPAGQNIAMSPGNMPLSGLAAGLAHLKPIIEAGTAFALCGLGDGYLLHQLAAKPPALYLDSQQGVWLIEPNAHIALTALMIHDYTGPAGPIEQARFQWFIGSGWEMRLRTAVLGDLLLPCPHVSIALGLEADGIQKSLNGIIAELLAGDERHQKTIALHYSSLDPNELAAVFGDHPPRKPRVLFLTTRFSTVLQFSTADTAAAFEQAGWETSTLIEPTSHHRIMTIATRQRVATFKPDLVFQIDHHRAEHGGVFPAKLPFVCWIQDHMEQLMTRDAGAQLGNYDFVLTDAGPLYSHNYGYPERQIIAMPKLTTPPPLLPRPATRGDDLVYVANNTRTPEALLNRLIRECNENAVEQAFVTECWQRLTDLYAAGESLPNYLDVREFLQDLLDEMGIVLSETRFDDFARVVNHPVCDALYRQQALRWTAECADDMGLKLALYGKGWENHPDFARYARGPIAHGREQQELTRRSSINFQIAPYFCLHQRLLDGICSGGFFLVRNHVCDVAPQAMLDLLETQCGSHVTRLADARACVPPPVRDRFENLVKECRRCLCSNGTEDPIRMVRAFEEALLLQPGRGVLPHLETVSFSDPLSLRHCITRFVKDADFREKIVADQRASIVERFTYTSAMRRATRRMGELLPRGASNAFIGIPINIDIGRAA